MQNENSRAMILDGVTRFMIGHYFEIYEKCISTIQVQW
jgi:hypothetical protein